MSDFPSLILPNLYLGSMSNANNHRSLQHLKITHILTLCPIRPRRLAQIQYKHVSVMDCPHIKISDKFQECIQFIQQSLNQGGRVLVHCFKGKSRSASIILAYLMRTRNLSYQQAFDYVRNKRKIQINFGFIRQLQRYNS